MSKENIEIVKRLYEAGPRGDVATLRQLIASDVEWQLPKGMELPMWAAGTYKGVDSVLRDVIGPAAQLFENFRLETEELIDLGNRVMSIGRFRGKAKNTGKELDSQFVMVLTLKDGKIVHHRGVSDTAAWLRALGLEIGKRATLPLKQQPVVTPPPH